jgi:hypothetical protein
MVALLNSNAYKKGFPFFEPSCAQLHSKFRKMLIRANFLQEFNMGIKNADFKYVKKVLKNVPIKVIS